MSEVYRSAAFKIGQACTDAIQVEFSVPELVAKTIHRSWGLGEAGVGVSERPRVDSARRTRYAAAIGYVSSLESKRMMRSRRPETGGTAFARRQQATDRIDRWAKSALWRRPRRSTTSLRSPNVDEAPGNRHRGQRESRDGLTLLPGTRTTITYLSVPPGALEGTTSTHTLSRMWSGSGPAVRSRTTSIPSAISVVW